MSVASTRNDMKCVKGLAQLPGAPTRGVLI